MPTHYDKLIRDRIPEIMDEAGVDYEIETLDEADFERALRTKLLEEASEAAEAMVRADLVKELADLQEVAATLMALVGIETDEVERIRAQRRRDRGAFERRLLLKSTTP